MPTEQHPTSPSSPSMTITLAIEAVPVITLDCANEGEQQRLQDWIVAQPELLDLASLAIELSERCTA